MRSWIPRIVSASVLSFSLVLSSLPSFPLSGVLPGLPSVGPSPAYAASPLPWQYKGFTIAAWGTDDFFSAGPALDQLASTGANSVTFVLSWYQSTYSSESIEATSATASDSSLIWAMAYAESRGLHVNIKPHIERLDGGWRATIYPTDITTWFGLTTPFSTAGTSYAAMIEHYASLLQQYGDSSSVLVIGAEMVTVATNTTTDPVSGACEPTSWNSTPLWLSMIAKLRTQFSGKLTYSANWGGSCWSQEFPNVPFWGSLDFIGISAYFPVASQGQTPTVSSMDASWSNWIATTLGPFQSRIGKPVMFTEIGYRSGTGTAAQPFDDWDSWPLDLQQQSDCYEALFESWSSVPWFVGTADWLWDVNANYPADTVTYQVQNKPAQSIVQNWFSAGEAPMPSPTASPTATPLPTATSTPTASTTAGAPSITIVNPQSNQTYGGTISVEASAMNASSVTYDVDGGTSVPMTFNANSNLWQAGLDTTTLANGPHDVDVVNRGTNTTTATDRAWNIQVSNSGTVATATATPPATATPSATPTLTPTTNPIAAAPSISIRNPQSNQTYSGSIMVQASATNAASVTYDVDGGTPVPMTLNSATGLWQATFDTTAYRNGAYDVDVVNHGTSGATATDRAWNFQISNTGNLANATATPTLTPTPSPTATSTPTVITSSAPSITIRNPQSDQTYRGTISVQATATNAASVTYDVDGGASVAMSFNSSTGVWQATLNTATLTDGAHNVDVVNHGTNSGTATDRAWYIEIAN